MIKLLIDQRNSCITYHCRSQNDASHALAFFGRTTGRTMVWLGSEPEEVVKFCNSVGIIATRVYTCNFAHTKIPAAYLKEICPEPLDYRGITRQIGPYIFII